MQGKIYRILQLTHQTKKKINREIIIFSGGIATTKSISNIDLYHAPASLIYELLEKYPVPSSEFFTFLNLIKEIESALDLNNINLARSHLNSFIKYFPKVLNITKSAHGIEIVCIYGINLAETLIKRGWDIKAMRFAYRLLARLESLKPPLFQLVKIYELYQILHYIRGNIEQLFYYNSESLKIYETLKLPNQIAGAYSQRSVYHSRFLNEHHEASKYAKTSLDLAYKSGEQFTINFAEYAAALNYIFTSDPEKGLLFLNIQVETDSKFKMKQIQISPIGEVIRLKFTALSYLKMKELTLANETLNEALDMAETYEFGHQRQRIKFLQQYGEDFAYIRNYLQKNG